ncbi:helix-turn-helix transcriptional regulator [Bacillus sp. Gen3]|uniref:helix-turn-helix domain-containing protein n=1 Tax=Heyndrickxia oleronia TaxID=38875 RepID=UPI0015D129CC|nr:helix-turn-helix transcriptional regulator [Bacillus sp. Gen3]
MKIGKTLAALRNKRGLTQDQIAEILDIKRARYNSWENDIAKPGIEMLDKIADFYGVKTDYILGRSEETSSWDSKLPELNDKDEKDIAKDLERIINNLEHENGYSHFDGQSIDDLDQEDKELLIASLENSIRMAKRLAKQKFTPKKYRK